MCDYLFRGKPCEQLAKYYAPAWPGALKMCEYHAVSERRAGRMVLALPEHKGDRHD